MDIIGENKVISEVLRKFKLKKTNKKFEYFDSSSGYKITFDWDGAGEYKDGSLALIELELGGISSWHIQTHISRLAIMINKGTPLTEIIWVVDKGELLTLKNEVNTWVAFFKTIRGVKLPNMKYITPKGIML